MAQGFFRPQDNPMLPKDVLDSSRSVLQFATGRKLDHRVFETDEEADAWRGFTADEHGCDTMKIGWTHSRLAELDLQVGSENWTSGFEHELVVHLMRGGTLPFVTTHAGHATATLVSPTGYLFTNFHLVSASIWFHDLTVGTENEPLYPEVNGIQHATFVADGAPAPHMNILGADGRSLGPVRLCYHDASIDFAVLKLENPPSHISSVALRKGRAVRHERIWQFGYPPRTARPEPMRQFLGYDDICGALTYSPGLLVSDPMNALWHTDADAAFGSSGSAVLGDDGALIGVRCGGGARQLPKADRFKYNRVTDVYSLRDVIPDVFHD